MKTYLEAHTSGCRYYLRLLVVPAFFTVLALQPVVAQSDTSDSEENAWSNVNVSEKTAGEAKETDDASTRSDDSSEVAESYKAIIDRIDEMKNGDDTDKTETDDKSTSQTGDLSAVKNETRRTLSSIAKEAQKAGVEQPTEKTLGELTEAISEQSADQERQTQPSSDNTLKSAVETASELGVKDPENKTLGAMLDKVESTAADNTGGAVQSESTTSDNAVDRTESTQNDASGQFFSGGSAQQAAEQAVGALTGGSQTAQSSGSGRAETATQRESAADESSAPSSQSQSFGGTEQAANRALGALTGFSSGGSSSAPAQNSDQKADQEPTESSGTGDAMQAAEKAMKAMSGSDSPDKQREQGQKTKESSRRANSTEQSDGKKGADESSLDSEKAKKAAEKAVGLMSGGAQSGQEDQDSKTSSRRSNPSGSSAEKSFDSEKARKAAEKAKELMMPDEGGAFKEGSSSPDDAFGESSEGSSAKKGSGLLKSGDAEQAADKVLGVLSKEEQGKVQSKINNLTGGSSIPDGAREALYSIRAIAKGRGQVENPDSKTLGTIFEQIKARAKEGVGNYAVQNPSLPGYVKQTRKAIEKLKTAYDISNPRSQVLGDLLDKLGEDSTDRMLEWAKHMVGNIGIKNPEDRTIKEILQKIAKKRENFMSYPEADNPYGGLRQKISEVIEAVKANRDISNPRSKTLGELINSGDEGGDSLDSQTVRKLLTKAKQKAAEAGIENPLDMTLREIIKQANKNMSSQDLGISALSKQGGMGMEANTLLALAKIVKKLKRKDIENLSSMTLRQLLERAGAPLEHITFGDPNSTKQQRKISRGSAPGLYVLNEQGERLDGTSPTLQTGNGKLLLYAGEQSSGGYGVSINSIDASGSDVTLKSAFVTPSNNPRMGSTMALTYPAEIVSFEAEPGTYNIQVDWDHPDSKRNSIKLTVPGDNDGGSGSDAISAGKRAVLNTIKKSAKASGLGESDIDGLAIGSILNQIEKKMQNQDTSSLRGRSKTSYKTHLQAIKSAVATLKSSHNIKNPEGMSIEQIRSGFDQPYARPTALD